MKKVRIFKYLSILILTTLIFSACSKSKKDTPKGSFEEKVMIGGTYYEGISNAEAFLSFEKDNKIKLIRRDIGHYNVIENQREDLLQVLEAKDKKSNKNSYYSLETKILSSKVTAYTEDGIEQWKTSNENPGVTLEQNVTKDITDLVSKYKTTLLVVSVSEDKKTIDEVVLQKNTSEGKLVHAHSMRSLVYQGDISTMQGKIKLGTYYGKTTPIMFGYSSEVYMSFDKDNQIKIISKELQDSTVIQKDESLYKISEVMLEPDSGTNTDDRKTYFIRMNTLSNKVTLYTENAKDNWNKDEKNVNKQITELNKEKELIDLLSPSEKNTTLTITYSDSENVIFKSALSLTYQEN